MTAEIADAVHPIIEHGRSLRARLEVGATVDWDREASVLKRLLAPLKPAAAIYDAIDEFDFDGALPGVSDESERLTRATIAYALTCWLDDFLPQAKSFDARRRARQFEFELYGTDEGGTRFWDEARYAETRGDTEALEVMHLCVMLGFRGEWRGPPVQVEAWALRISQLLDRVTQPWSMPASLEPAPVRVGARLEPPWRRMAFALLAAFALIVPAATVLLLRRWTL